MSRTDEEAAHGERYRYCADREWKLWRTICDTLVEMKAVTEHDRNAPSLQTGTPGTDLFWLIREWGDARVLLENCSICRGALSVRKEEP